MRVSRLMTVVCLAVLSLAVAAFAADIAMSVTVAPSVLVLSAPTEWITIHTDMPLASVDRSSLVVTTNGVGVPITTVKADARGQMVLKIDQADVDPFVAPPSATFVVVGSTTAGLTFEGSDTIRVK